MLGLGQLVKPLIHGACPVELTSKPIFVMGTRLAGLTLCTHCIMYYLIKRRWSCRPPLDISERPCLSLDLPLSMKTLSVSDRGNRLSDRNLRTSAINAQQVLPGLL